MTDYETIVAALRSKKLESLETTMARCVDEEADDLAAVPSHAKRRTAGYLKRVLEDAQSFYAAEILDELFTDPPRTLTPEQILGTRRTAKTWAIAAIMRREGLMDYFKGTSLSGLPEAGYGGES